MRKKELKLIVTFHTTTEAMAMEKMCREQQVPGRLIPVPRVLSAGCGLSWCADVEEEVQISRAIEAAGIEIEAIHQCML